MHYIHWQIGRQSWNIEHNLFGFEESLCFCALQWIWFTKSGDKVEANSNGLAFDWGEGKSGYMKVEMDKGSVEGMPWGSAHLTCCLKFFLGVIEWRGKGTLLQLATCASCLKDELNPLVESCSAPFTTDGAYRPILVKMPHGKLEDVNAKLVLSYRCDLSLCLIATSERFKWPFHLSGLFSSGFWTGPCGKEGNEMLPVKERWLWSNTS